MGRWGGEREGGGAAWILARALAGVGRAVLLSRACRSWSGGRVCLLDTPVITFSVTSLAFWPNQRDRRRQHRLRKTSR